MEECMTSARVVDESLVQRRLYTERQWLAFVSGKPLPSGSPGNHDIPASWQRSAHNLPPQKDYVVPCDDEQTAGLRWKNSPLRQAAEPELGRIRQLVQEGSLVAALSDAQGHLLWTCASKPMRGQAEAVNFVAGGHWNESSAGTNAVGLTATLRRSTTVFSCEHYLPYVHDWVCYAAPILHPRTQEMLGVLDISAMWEHHTPLGPSAVKELAGSIARRLPDIQPRAELEIFALGQPKVYFRGKLQHLSHRQMEILSLLALNPQGLTLDAFHAALYGDASISTSTLKAEFSHLRRLLDGQVSSRHYRLTVPVWADFIEFWQLLRRNLAQDAIGIYRGPFLPQSNSPELEEWRHCLEAALGRVLDDCDDFSMLVGKMCRGSVGSELIRERLESLMARQ